jgi:hypothetical protein
MRETLKRLIRNEKGQAMILVLILLMIGGLVVTPALSMSTALKAGQVYENKMYEFYAADAGIEDALWYLQSSDRLLQLDSAWESDDVSWSFAYDMTDPDDPIKPDDINGKEVDVTITHIWLLDGLCAYSPDYNNQLEVIGYFNSDNDTNCIVDFITESGDVGLDQIGVWLPNGYGYVANSVTINGVSISDPLVTNPTITPHQGGTALVWDYTGTDFEDLSDLVAPPSGGGMTPGASFPPTIRLSFDFTPPTGTSGINFFFPWMVIEGQIAWDISFGFYHVQSEGITPTISSTTNETYVAWGTPRLIPGTGGSTSSIYGDYIAIGNSLMTNCWQNRQSLGWGRYRYYNPGPPCNYTDTYRNCRGTYYTESSAQIDSGAVPSDAQIAKAYLYWTAWWTTDGADTEAILEVDGTPVGAGGTVDADRYYVLPTSGSNGYQYACFADVTDEVTAITADVNNTTFTVGEVDAVPATEGGDASLQNQAANAGWSMIIIYSSAFEDAHQIYLYDQLAYLWAPSGTHAEFTIVGFEAPPSGSSDAKLAIFAAEGDDWDDWTYDDHIRFQGQQDTAYCYLGDPFPSDPNPWDDVFNGVSTAPGFTPSPLWGQPSGGIAGVDIDIYTEDKDGISLSDHVAPGDTSAKIRIETEGGGSGCDGIMLTYVVFSVRSILVPSGSGEFDVGIMIYETD